MAQQAEGTAQVIPLRRREHELEWARRFDRAAARLVDGEVLAAARFLRPRGLRAFAGAVADAPVAAAKRAARRPRQPRLPEALLVAVTADRIHLLRARTAPGSGPVPTATGTIASWERARVAVIATPEAGGTRLALSPRGAGRVELIGPPDALTARVVAALRLTAPELVPAAAPASPVPAPVAPAPSAPVPAPVAATTRAPERGADGSLAAG